jgi:peroxiredoxin
MGRVALAAEQPEAALALLDSATARGWTLELFDAAASARLQVGDVTGGVEMLARLAVDPAYGGPDAAARALTLVRPDEWAREVDRARTRMIEVTLAAARARGIPGPLRVSDEEGTEHDLQELIGGHVSVVALFWPACRTCVSELHQLRDLQRRLPVSLRTVLVSGSPLLPSQLEFLRAEGVPFPVVVDNYGAVAEALEPRGRPQYFLLDRHGTIRFSYTSLEDIPRQVLALSGGEPPVT